MRCKPGDLAVIVNTTSAPENNGKIVRVIRRVIPGEMLKINGLRVRLRRDRTDSWLIETEGSDLIYCTSFAGFARRWRVRQRPLGDRFLQPLRDSDGTDEILRITGKPATDSPMRTV